MDAAVSTKPVTINRWLPYWAVLQVDMHQTLRSWVYRVWVLVTLLAAVGCLFYRFALTHGGGIEQPASHIVADLLRWTLIGSVTLIVVLCAGSISADRGSMADSVLSRGISRYQYFMGKWHSRLVMVLATFWILAVAALIAGAFLLHGDLSLPGCLVALVSVSAILLLVITCGVTVSTLCNNTLLGITLLWVLLYGGGFALSQLPTRYPSPARLLAALPYTLKGNYDVQVMLQLLGWSALGSLLVAVIGLAYFARRDI